MQALHIPASPFPSLPSSYTYNQNGRGDTASVSLMWPLYVGGATDAARALVAAQGDEGGAHVGLGRLARLGPAQFAGQPQFLLAAVQLRRQVVAQARRFLFQPLTQPQGFALCGSSARATG